MWEGWKQETGRVVLDGKAESEHAVSLSAGDWPGSRGTNIVLMVCVIRKSP